MIYLTQFGVLRFLTGFSGCFNHKRGSTFCNKCKPFSLEKNVEPLANLQS